LTEFLLATAGVILFTVAVGLVRILSGPGDADRMMAAQLIGTGGIGSLLLIRHGLDRPSSRRERGRLFGDMTDGFGFSVLPT
jgi:multicomponent Na+:H+ antiporter subunit F